MVVVDDSGFMRLVLSDIVNSDPQLKVIRTGKNGLEAVELVEKFKPDVLVLDMMMSEYDGEYAIRNIMKKFPLPIIVVSNINETNGALISDILELGAFDFLSKPVREKKNIRNLQYLLPDRIKNAKVGFKKQRHLKGQVNVRPHTFTQELNFDAMVVGASTGGPSTVEAFLNQLPANLPIPVIIAQHMPTNFLPSYVTRLSKLRILPVALGKDGTEVLPGNIYILSGTSNHILVKKGVRIHIRETVEKFQAFNNPSIDGLFISASNVYKQKLIGIVLTGMGSDGRDGILAVKKNGGKTIAQDEKTSIVYGMPREAYRTGKVDHVLPIDDLGGFVVSCIS